MGCRLSKQQAANKVLLEIYSIISSKYITIITKVTLKFTIIIEAIFSPIIAVIEVKSSTAFTTIN